MSWSNMHANSSIPAPAYQVARAACDGHGQKFYLYYQQTPQLISVHQQEVAGVPETISASEILLRYGWINLVSLLKNDAVSVSPRTLGNQVEVLGAFKITGIGLLVIMRTEGKKLAPGDIISSKDHTQQWRVVSIPTMFMNPISAYMKNEAMEAQGIFTYLTSPLGNTSKPHERELLQRAATGSDAF